MPKQAARLRTRPRQRAHRIPTRAPRGSTRATGRGARTSERRKRARRPAARRRRRRRGWSRSSARATELSLRHRLAHERTAKRRGFRDAVRVVTEREPKENASDAPACSSFHCQRPGGLRDPSGSGCALVRLCASGCLLREKRRREGCRARACSLLQGRRRGERCVTPAGRAARIERLGHRRARACADVEPSRRLDCECPSTSVHAGPGVPSARPTLASADLDRLPTKENARTATQWRASVRCPRRARWDVSVTLCKEDPMKPVPLLFLLACSAVLACVALPPPLPPANDPANDKAAEAPYSPPAQLPAGSSAGADAGAPAEPHHHQTRPGADGGTP